MVSDRSTDDEQEELEDDEEIIIDDDSVPPPTGDPADVDVESLEAALEKKEAVVEPEEDEEPGIASPRDERAEPATVKVIPPQPTEFICKRCFLVKHRSQLKDKSKGLCRDCA